jgi:hypothetical protein
MVPLIPKSVTPEKSLYRQLVKLDDSKPLVSGTIELHGDTLGRERRPMSLSLVQENPTEFPHETHVTRGR